MQAVTRRIFRSEDESPKIRDQRMNIRPTQMPNTTYASRGRQRNFEATRKDDLESWTYCVSDREMILKRSKINFEVAEIFHKKLMPWNPDQKYLSENAAHKDSLHHKRAFCQGKCMFELKE